MAHRLLCHAGTYTGRLVVYIWHAMHEDAFSPPFSNGYSEQEKADAPSIYKRRFEQESRQAETYRQKAGGRHGILQMPPFPACLFSLAPCPSALPDRQKVKRYSEQQVREGEEGRMANRRHISRRAA